MNEDYQQDSNEDDEENHRPSFKKLTKNQQIYGDFYEAYEPEPVKNMPKQYQQFKAGSTIETYSAQVEVDLPKRKPTRKVIEEEQEDDQPMLGKFNLSSFLNQLGGLDQINEEEDQDSSQLPVGLNEKILTHLQLVKAQDWLQDQVKTLQAMNFEQYMRAGKSKPKVEPKYKTQQEKELAKQFSDGYGVGFKMLQKMGFKVTKGLGKQQTGIQRPVQAVFKTSLLMKDEAEAEAKAKDGSENQSEATEQQRPIAQKLFQYKSKNKNVGNLLIDLKNSYDKLQSQMYFYSKQVQSFKKQEQLNLSLQCQKEKEIVELKKQVNKLEQVQRDIYHCLKYPHLGLKYKLDSLYVKQLYQKLANASFQFLLSKAEQEIRKTIAALSQFYLSKTKQTMREYEQTIQIQHKMHKRISKPLSKQEEIIDLDSVNNQNEEVATLTTEDQQKITQFMAMIISKTLVPPVETMLRRQSIDNITDLRVIELLQLIKKIDRKEKVFPDLVKYKIVPLCTQYLENVKLEELEQEGSRKLPHHVIFPWLTVVAPSQLGLINFFKRLTQKVWNIQNATFYSIIAPFMKFASRQQYDYISNCYIAPRLLYELQKFSINETNIALLNGFVKYSQFLQRQVKIELLENTIMLQIHTAYKQYCGQMNQSQLKKWLNRWRKFTQKIVPGFLEGYFQQFSIIV